MSLSTPWGPAQHQKTIARGIVEVDTAGHGGIILSPERWEEFRKHFPTFTPYGGDGALEEDCDWALAPVLWPQYFEPSSVFHAVRLVLTYDTNYDAQHSERLPEPVPYFPEGRAYLASPAGRGAMTVYETYARTVAGLWEQGAMCSSDTRGKWDVMWCKDGVTRWERAADYPKSKWASDEELNARGALPEKAAKLQTFADLCPPALEAAAPELPKTAIPRLQAKVQQVFALPQWDEAQCGGVFDGSSVTSDADPGL